MARRDRSLHAVALWIGGVAGRAGHVLSDVEPIAVKVPPSQTGAIASPADPRSEPVARAPLDSPDGYLSLRRRLVAASDLSASLNAERRTGPAPLPATRNDWLRALN